MGTDRVPAVLLQGLIESMMYLRVVLCLETPAACTECLISPGTPALCQHHHCKCREAVGLVSSIDCRCAYRCCLCASMLDNGASTPQGSTPASS